jgi:hypothetical protein
VTVIIKKVSLKLLDSYLPQPSNPIQLLIGQSNRSLLTKFDLQKMELSMDEIQVVSANNRPALFDMAPLEKVKFVTEMANVLKDVIEKQRLYTVIQGKKHVQVDGWTTLGTLLGILPREKSVIELPDSSFVAEVELVRYDSGRVVAGASSLCSVEEKRWATADKYARRSMAVTRATGKAYRLAFSWIIKMAGYESTPAEEMDGIETKTKEVIFDPSNRKHQDAVIKKLEEKKIPSDQWDAVGVALKGRPTTHLDNVIKELSL